MSDSEPQSVTPPLTQPVTPAQAVSSSSTPSSTSTVESKQILNTDLKRIFHKMYQFKYMSVCNSASNSIWNSAFNLVSNCLWEKLVNHINRYFADIDYMTFRHI